MHSSMRRLPDPGRGSAERLYSPSDVVRSGLCIGCGSCAASSPDARMDWDRNGFLKPKGPPEWFDRKSALFSRQCPFSPSVENEDSMAGRHFERSAMQHQAVGRFEAAYVGFATEGAFRMQGSSGGLTNWVAAQLLRTGVIDAVAHVVPAGPTAGRFFEYRISRSTDELGAGAKSRYYPIELSSVLREIRSSPGRYAVVGVPCFIKAIRLLQRDDPVLRERITHTLGLFCGHMKSAAMVESFAWQLGTEVDRVRALDYRSKDEARPANWYRTHLDLADGSAREKDWWHLADGDWGAGFFQNPACNWCDDVVAETADIAFGDAWVEPYSSDGRGTNVVIARTAEMKSLLEHGRSTGALQLELVSADFIVETQAAGLRHRREGLAYRLSWRGRRLRPPKRVTPSGALPLRRKIVFRLRYHVAKWSHRFFRLARAAHSPRIYLVWARSVLRIYQAAAWSRGRIGKAFDWLLPDAK
jgi:coenzyme F420-reducing hydrogenase beta subunit